MDNIKSNHFITLEWVEKNKIAYCEMLKNTMIHKFDEDDYGLCTAVRKMEGFNPDIPREKYLEAAGITKEKVKELMPYKFNNGAFWFNDKDKETRILFLELYIERLKAVSKISKTIGISAGELGKAIMDSKAKSFISDSPNFQNIPKPKNKDNMKKSVNNYSPEILQRLRTLAYYKKLIDAERFIVTGGLVLHMHGLKKQIGEDVDVILIKPNEGAMKALEHLEIKNENDYPDAFMSIKTETGLKIDFWVLPKTVEMASIIRFENEVGERYDILADDYEELEISMVMPIINAKKSYPQDKHLFERAAMAQKICSDGDWGNFVRNKIKNL